MKHKFSSMGRVAIALVLALSLSLVMAVPVMALDGSGACTVTPTEVVAGSTGNELTFTFTATESMDGGEITIEAPANWSVPQGTIETAGYTTATSTGIIGTPTFALQVVTIPLITIVDTDTITVVYGDGGGASGATAQLTAGTATFVTKSKFSAVGSLVELTLGSPEVTVNPDTVAKLAFTANPAGSVSGIAFTTQPTIEAQDLHGNIVTDFADDITISVKTGAGTLLGTATQLMSNGTLTTGGLGYTATADQEPFTLAANNVTPPSLTEGVSASVTCDVVATKIIVFTQPDTIVSGVSMTQPVIHFVNDGDVLDTFENTDIVTVGETGNGSISAGTVAVTAVNGVVTYAGLIYTALADGEAVTFTFTDDTIGTNDFNAAPVSSGAQTADVVATQLFFTTQPAAGANSGALLGTQPIVAAQDADGLVDTDFTETVTITANVGTLSGDADIVAVDGVATFTDLVHTASADNENTTLTANDEDGVDTDLPTVDSSIFITLVKATKLVIVTQPDGAVSGEALLIQPVIHAVDADGTLDEDYGIDCVVARETGTGEVTGGPSPMALGVTNFTNVKVTEEPVVHDSYTLSFTSGAFAAVVSDTFKVYDKVLGLNDSTWTLVSTDDFIIYSGDNTSGFEGSVVSNLIYRYTDSGFLTATVEHLKPVEAIYVKTTGSDGLVGLNYDTDVAPGASIKNLVEGWNLIGVAGETAPDEINAAIILTQLRYATVGQVEGCGLAAIVSQGDYNTSEGFYIPTLDSTVWDTGGDLNTTLLDEFDGYWVYMNIAKSFGVFPVD